MLSELHPTYAWKCLLFMDVKALLWDSVHAVRPMKVTVTQQLDEAEKG